jgi:hypothetical protein
MLTTAGDTALMTGAREGSATATEAADPVGGMRSGSSNTKQGAFNGD